MKYTGTIFGRFIERDTIQRQMENNSEYIFPEDIESILNERDDWDDLTFRFTPKDTGWHTDVFDNVMGTKITINDLNDFAMNYYIKQLVELTKEKYLQPKELNIAI